MELMRSFEAACLSLLCCCDTRGKMEQRTNRDRHIAIEVLKQCDKLEERLANERRAIEYRLERAIQQKLGEYKVLRHVEGKGSLHSAHAAMQKERVKSAIRDEAKYLKQYKRAEEKARTIAGWKESISDILENELVVKTMNSVQQVMAKSQVELAAVRKITERIEELRDNIAEVNSELSFGLEGTQTGVSEEELEAELDALMESQGDAEVLKTIKDRLSETSFASHLVDNLPDVPSDTSIVEEEPRTRETSRLVYS